MSEELTEQDVENIVRALKDMKVKPKADTTDAFKNWMKEFSSPKTDDILYMPYIPKLPSFSGNGDDVSYDLWRYQVACLIKDNNRHEIIAQAIRRSVCGEASRIVMRLGVEATVDDVIDKMDSIFGSVDQQETLLAQFYTACQGEDEDVSSWGCRLEDILNKARQRGKVYRSDINEMPRNKFWRGLRLDLRDVSSHKFDRIKDYNQLLVAIREIEKQRRQDKIERNGVQPEVESNPQDDEVVELRSLVQRLTTQMQRQEPRQQHAFKKDIPYETIVHRPIDKSLRRRRESGFKTCWRCGQPGHIAIGCRVSLDSSRKAQRAMNYQQMSVQEEHMSTNSKTKEHRLTSSIFNTQSVSIHEDPSMLNNTWAPL